MKVNKRVSDKVIAANRANGRKSTGPHDSSASKMNALKHGLLSKRLLLNEEEEKEFKQLLKDLELEFEPKTASQEMVLQEVATCWCKLQRTHSWEMEQLGNRRRSAEMVFRTLEAECDHDELSHIDRGEELSRCAQLGWECREIAIRSGNREQELKRGLSAGPSASDKERGGHFLVEARISTGMENILRYQRSLKNDFYRAIEVLRRLKTKDSSGPIEGDRNQQLK
jgi:hypothetical protein